MELAGGVLWRLVTKAVTIFKNLFFHTAFYLTSILGHTQYAPTKTRSNNKKKRRKITAQPSKDLQLFKCLILSMQYYMDT